MDENRLAAWRMFLTAHGAVVRALEQELADETGLPLGWYEVLLHLRRAPDRRLRMHELADRILLTPSGLTRVVDRMADAGLVRREQCASDRRVYYATLTERGRKRLRATTPVHLRGIDEHFACHLTDREAEVLQKALGKVLADVRPDLAERLAQ